MLLQDKLNIIQLVFLEILFLLFRGAFHYPLNNTMLTKQDLFPSPTEWFTKLLVEDEKL